MIRASIPETIDVDELSTNTTHIGTLIGKITIVDGIEIICMRMITTMKDNLLPVVRMKIQSLAATVKRLLLLMHCTRR